MKELTGRVSPQVEVPEFLASLGLKAMQAAGVSAPIAGQGLPPAAS